MICELIFKCKVTQKYQLIGLYCPQFTIYTHRRNYLARPCGGRLRFLPYSAGFCLQPQPVSDFQRVKLGNIHKISNFSFGFITPEQGLIGEHHTPACHGIRDKYQPEKA